MARPLPLLVVALGALVMVHEAGGWQAARPAAPAAAPVSGNGGGLATFGDRGLTTFGDRGLTTFSDRGLTSFSDIPLLPMGGLDVPGPSGRPQQRVRPSSRRTPRLVGSTGLPSSASGTSTSLSGTSSVASIHGVTLPPPPATAVVVLPTIALPAVTLDHRPALATLERTLRDEIERARRRGDADLARSLATGMQR